MYDEPTLDDREGLLHAVQPGQAGLGRPMGRARDQAAAEQVKVIMYKPTSLLSVRLNDINNRPLLPSCPSRMNK